jgi:hypothetical protein
LIEGKSASLSQHVIKTGDNARFDLPAEVLVDLAGLGWTWVEIGGFLDRSGTGENHRGTIDFSHEPLTPTLSPSDGERENG